jgi:3alpha(or 20beta)-hydroxysteroid dehydrogenase
MAGRLDGQVILVTGASGGIGRATVERLLSEGARVAATDLREADPPLPAGAALRFFIHDVSNEQAWRDAVAATLAWGGKLTGLVNAAGIVNHKMIADVTVEDLDQVYAVNQRGTALGIKHGAAAMRGTGGGSIVNLSSLAGMRGVVTTGAYAATKWAVRGMTKVAAAEHGADEIRVNSIHPGAVDTPMLNQAYRDQGSFGPLNRIGKPSEIASVVAFLLSDDSSYMTGAELTVDGGIGV